MFFLSKKISPLAYAPGVISCIRFKHLISVVLPQPEGPINAVTEFLSIFRLISLRTSLLCNPAYRLYSTIYGYRKTFIFYFFFVSFSIGSLTLFPHSFQEPKYIFTFLKPSCFKIIKVFAALYPPWQYVIIS